MDSLEAEVAAFRHRLDAVGSDCAVSDVCCCDHVCPGWNASVEYLNWTAHGRRAGLRHYHRRHGGLATGVGAVQNLTFGRDSGLRTGLSYTTRTGWEIGFGYTHFDTQTAATAAAPAGGNMWARPATSTKMKKLLTAGATRRTQLRPLRPGSEALV